MKPVDVSGDLSGRQTVVRSQKPGKEMEYHGNGFFDDGPEKKSWLQEFTSLKVLLQPSKGHLLGFSPVCVLDQLS